MSKAGVFIDIDGVVLHGGKPFEFSVQAINELWENEIPFVFVTNGTYSSANLVNSLTNILGLPFTNDHVVVAPSPCKDLTEYHNKRVLVCGQDDSVDLVKELGFTDYITIDDLVEIFPLLDFVDHNKRKKLIHREISVEMQSKIDNFKPVEAIFLLGEPINWEKSLQIIIDVLMTNGDPRSNFKFVPSPHLPIIACNKDLTFKGAADLPRFGHGAFLECLETLFMKITRNKMCYTHLMGKPYIITYEYAAKQLKKLLKNEDKIITKFYIIGDNPDVDINGANLFKEHLANLEKFQSNSNKTEVESILVCTGVYNPKNDLLYHLDHLFDDTSKLHESFSDMSLKTKTKFILSTNNSRRKSVPNLIGLDKKELKIAMSRHNSFISYFDNKLNLPDITVGNLYNAIRHIIDEEK